MQYKIRTFYHVNRLGEKAELNYSLTVPKEILTLIGSETKFTAEKIGASIVFSSGININPTTSEVKEYNFENVRV